MPSHPVRMLAQPDQAPGAVVCTLGKQSPAIGEQEHGKKKNAKLLSGDKIKNHKSPQDSRLPQPERAAPSSACKQERQIFPRHGFSGFEIFRRPRLGEGEHL